MKAVLMSGSFKKIEIHDEIINFINKNLVLSKKIAFIASSFDNYELNDHFVNKLIKCFEVKKVFFDKKAIIDSRISKKLMADSIKESNIVFLLGGDTLKQIDSINKYDLITSIKSKDKIIIGISSGAINMASKVVLAKDEEDNIPELSIYSGIGITDINIEPHCDFKNKTHWKDLEEASLFSSIVVMNDDAFIIIDGSKNNYFGSYIILKNKKIIYNNKQVLLEEFLKDINYD